jgi:hypothetical protein
MKTLVLLLLFSTPLCAQDYYPFRDGSPKRFHETNAPAENDHYFYNISSSISNDTLYFGQYLKENTNAQVDVSGTSCSGWGGGLVNLVDSTWLGRNFHFDMSNFILTHWNKSGEALTFDFGLALGDSALIYQSGTEEYYLVHAYDDEQTVLTYVDSVKNFRIAHYDPMGTVIPSALHSSYLRLGKNIGLITFLNCYEFPAQEVGMTLLGQIEPRIGTYQMTYDEAFPWEVGDVLQYRGYTPLMTPLNCISYLEYTVINKVITADSVFIYLDSAEQITYNFDTATVQIILPNAYYNIRYNSPIKFKKNACIFEMPMNFKHQYQYTHYYGDSANFCGNYAQEIQSGNYTRFCDSCSCLPPADGFMQSYPTIHYTAGRGITHRDESYYGPPTGYRLADLVYDNLSVNGNAPCGTDVGLGIDEHDAKVSIAPNPTEGLIRVTNAEKPEAIVLYNTHGQQLERWNSNSNDQTLDLSAYEPGIYLLKIHFARGIISRKIILR